MNVNLPRPAFSHEVHAFNTCRMCVPRARLAIGIGVALPLAAVILENCHLLFSGSSGHLPLVHNLSLSQLESYDRDGFILLPALVPPALVDKVLEELHGIQAEVEDAGSDEAKAWDEAASGAHQNQCTFAFARDADGSIQQVQPGHSCSLPLLTGLTIAAVLAATSSSQGAGNRSQEPFRARADPLSTDCHSCRLACPPQTPNRR